ncbi:hypothetical protein ACHOLT_06700 [Desulfitobacterium sp. Sab5]|uniref:hypothetical protein n=1 Tax=Desulfitobacterium nosdiversum TaxID=3375356 RepID=UPI003CF5CFFA
MKLLKALETLTIAELEALVERVSVIDPTVPAGSTTEKVKKSVHPNRPMNPFECSSSSHLGKE